MGDLPGGQDATTCRGRKSPRPALGNRTRGSASQRSWGLPGRQEQGQSGAHPTAPRSPCVTPPDVTRPPADVPSDLSSFSYHKARTPYPGMRASEAIQMGEEVARKTRSSYASQPSPTLAIPTHMTLHAPLRVLELRPTVRTRPRQRLLHPPEQHLLPPTPLNRPSTRDHRRHIHRRHP
jgi:hypothetical protein